MVIPVRTTRFVDYHFHSDTHVPLLPNMKLASTILCLSRSSSHLREAQFLASPHPHSELSIFTPCASKLRSLNRRKKGKKKCLPPPPLVFVPNTRLHTRALPSTSDFPSFCFNRDPPFVVTLSWRTYFHPSLPPSLERHEPSTMDSSYDAHLSGHSLCRCLIFETLKRTPLLSGPFQLLFFVSLFVFAHTHYQSVSPGAA